MKFSINIQSFGAKSSRFSAFFLKNKRTFPQKNGPGLFRPDPSMV